MKCVNILILLLCWYIYISFVDYAIHKYIMHNDNTCFQSLREKHKRHHLEASNKVTDLGTSITFTYDEMFIIGFISGLLVLFVSFLLCNNVSKSLLIFFIHLVIISIGIGIHNFSHVIFHNHDEIFDNCLQIPIPTFFMDILHNHHELHHLNPKRNLCVVFLGFDNLISCFDLLSI